MPTAKTTNADVRHIRDWLETSHSRSTIARRAVVDTGGSASPTVRHPAGRAS
jgi:hypothetical protein